MAVCFCVVRRSRSSFSHCRDRAPAEQVRLDGPFVTFFITICTKDRKMLFAPVGADSISARMVEITFHETMRQYDGVDSPIYVVIPNHFHAIITVSRADMESAPTICTQNRRCILSRIVGTGVLDCPQPELTRYGETADKYVKQLNDFYEHLSAEKYVIMPNHIHLLLWLKENNTDNGPSRTPVPTNIERANR